MAERYDDEAPEVRILGPNAGTKQAARRTYECNCGRRDCHIEIGETYTRYVMLTDGVFGIQRVCAKPFDHVSWANQISRSEGF